MIMISQFGSSQPQAHLIMLFYNFHADHKVLNDRFTKQNAPVIYLVETVLKKRIFAAELKLCFFMKLRAIYPTLNLL